MVNSKATKKALFMSMLSLLLCFTMLMGATFAWFTDTVTSKNNIIKAGNLDIELYYQVEGQSDWTKVTDTSNIFKENALWEPGYTEVVRLKAVNEGSLALKYQLGVNVASETGSVNVNGENFKLSDHIKFGIVDGAEDYNRDTAIAAVNANATPLATAYSSETISLYPKNSTEGVSEKVVTLVVYMPTTVDNVANHAKDAAVPEINLGLNVTATQLAAEVDSFDNQYDADATYADIVVNDAASLEEAIAAGEKLIGINGTIALTKSLGATGVTFVGTTKGAGIDFGTYGISGTGNTFKNLSLDNDRAGWYKGMQYSDGENTTYINCTIANGVTTYGDSTFDGCTFAELPAGNYNLFIYDGKNITVKNSTFIYGNRAIKIYNEGGSKDITVSVSNSTFLMSDTSVLDKSLIEIDDTYMNSVKVDVKNITVDGGLKAQGIYRINDGALDTSTAKSVVTVDGVMNAVTPDTIDEAIKATVEAGSNSEFILSSGTYSDDIGITVDNYGGTDNDIVFKAAEGADVVFTGTTTLGYRNQGVGSAMWNGNVTFEGITFDHASEKEHSIDVQDVGSLTLKNCTIIGDGEYGITSARGNATGPSKIVGCTFENAGMQLLGNFATGLIIDDCDFNNSCINVQAGNGVTVQNCRFDSTLTDANLGDNSFYLVRSNSTPITVKNCTVKVDSDLTEVATSQPKWGMFFNRGTTNWTVSDVEITMTDAAVAQTELLVTKCTSTGKINTTNLTVNGVAQ